MAKELKDMIKVNPPKMEKLGKWLLPVLNMLSIFPGSRQGHSG